MSHAHALDFKDIPALALEHIEDAYALFDLATERVIEANPAFWRWVDKPSCPLALDEVFPEHDQAKRRAAITSGGRFVFSTRARVTDQTRLYPVEFTFHLATVFEAQHIVVHGRNVSKAHEKEVLLKSISKVIDQNNTQLRRQKEQVAESQRNLKQILDNTVQGFFTFDANLLVEKDYSAVVERLLVPAIAGQNICDVLGLSTAENTQFFRMAFAGVEWDLLEDIAPKRCHMHGRILKLEFRPIAEDGTTKKIMGIVTDVTELTRLEQQAEKSARTGRAIVKILQSKADFVSLVALVDEIDPESHPAEAIKRAAHTLKGGFSIYACVELSDVCHRWEEQFKGEYTTAGAAAFKSELAGAIAAFLEEHRGILGISESTEQEALVNLADLRSIIRAVGPGAGPFAESLERLVLRPAEQSLQWLADAWVVTAEKLEKEVTPMAWTMAEPIFPDPYKRLFRALVHIVRNSADHGIELPDERVMLGKARPGNLSVSLALEHGIYHMRFKDDGRGIELDRLEAALRRKGRDVPDDERSLVNCIFMPSFSTREVVTDTSGRGVGLDAVRTEAEALGGGAEATSVEGEGLEIHVWFKRRSMAEWAEGEV